MQFARLKDFARWYLAHDRIPIAPPADQWLHVHPQLVAVVLWRAAPYQAELIIMPRGSAIPPHRHPNVSSHDVGLAGDGEPTIAGRVFRDAEHVGAMISRRVPLPAGVPHGGGAPNGGLFLSLQEWRNGVAPTCIVDDWENVA